MIQRAHLEFHLFFPVPESYKKVREIKTHSSQIALTASFTTYLLNQFALNLNSSEIPII